MHGENLKLYIKVFRAQPEDGSVRGAEKRCCFK